MQTAAILPSEWPGLPESLFPRANCNMNFSKAGPALPQYFWRIVPDGPDNSRSYSRCVSERLVETTVHHISVRIYIEDSTDAVTCGNVSFISNKISVGLCQEADSRPRPILTLAQTTMSTASKATSSIFKTQIFLP